jgi:hypothetical protein
LTTREYLRIQKVEIIIRFDLVTMQPPVSYGYYEIKIDQEWVPVYVRIPRVNTAAKPVHRMEISSEDKRFSMLLRVYKRIMEDTSLYLRDSSVIYQVEYNCLQKLNSIYVMGSFLVEKVQGEPGLPGLFPFLCRLSDGTELKGTAGEIKRGEERVLYLDLDGMLMKDTLRFLKELDQGELILAEILSI